jgi:DNA repair exonuclease SbcCD ATPase subunit
MCDEDKSLRKQLEKLAVATVEYRAAAADAERATAAAKVARAESVGALDQVAAAKADLVKGMAAQNAEADALRNREQALKAREDALKPKWEALRREALALQGRASRMAATATAFARDLEG